MEDTDERQALLAEEKQSSMETDTLHPGQIPCLDPSNGRLLGHVKAMTPAEVNETVGRAKKAAKAWRESSFQTRRQLMKELLRLTIEHQDEISRASSQETGKTCLEAVLGEVAMACEKLSWLISSGEKYLRPEPRPSGTMTFYKKAWVEFHPVGVVGAIIPWNWPFQFTMLPLSTAVFAGNAIVLKVSEHASWSSTHCFSRLVSKALQVVGAPPDLVQFVTGYADAGQALVTSGVDKVVFVGSDAVGRRVLAAAAPNLTPVTLELGGKDPFIVCEDADLDQVVPLATQAAFMNSGQNCIAGERFLVHEKIYRTYLQRVLEVVRQMRYGPGTSGMSADMGAMCMPGSPERVHALVMDAVAKGASVLAGGELPAASGDTGYFYPPTVLTNVGPGMRLWNEQEIFGPVMCVLPFTTDDEAVALANDCRYGLASSVFTRDPERARKIGRRLETGMTNLNDLIATAMVGSLPFGGVKHSGFGTFNGVEGLRGMCVTKAMCEDRYPWLMKSSQPASWLYPVKPEGYPLAQFLIAMFYGPTWHHKIKAFWGLLRLLLFPDKNDIASAGDLAPHGAAHEKQA